MIRSFSIHEDGVINGKFITAVTDYDFAINRLVSLMDKLDIQRKLQNARFYKRLEQDLSLGCIMPPLTIAFIAKPSEQDEDIEKYINDNIEKGFVLDGIQRLNTLRRAFDNDPSFNLSRPLFLNIIICPSMDNLLYRMVTLNNGQKPMSARHQIEILTSKLFDFGNLPVDYTTEKERGRRSTFNKADLVKGYIAFLSNSTNIDNQKIIEEKMDELIAEKIINSNITKDGLEFTSILDTIGRLSSNTESFDWFRVPNNLIGFCVGIRNSYSFFQQVSPDDFFSSISTLDFAFSSFDISKIKLGQQRRKVVSHFISHYELLHEKDENELLDIISEVS